MQRTETVTTAFAKQMLAQPEVENVFAISGLNLLTGTNSSYAATVFMILSPAKRAGAAHGAAAVAAARANRIGSGRQEATVLAVQPAADSRYRPPPAGFEFILEDRSGGAIELVCRRDTANFSGRPITSPR